MPLILPKEQEKNWINPKLSKEEVKKLIQPFSEEEMAGYTISTMANSSKARRVVPEILQEVEYPELVNF
jgi:putative SOS response-associated peptidase YedK